MGVTNICAMVTGLGRVYASNGLKANALRVVTKTLYKYAFKASTLSNFSQGKSKSLRPKCPYAAVCL